MLVFWFHSISMHMLTRIAAASKLPALSLLAAIAVTQVTSVYITGRQSFEFEQQHLEHLARTFPSIKDLYMEYV
jgi:hypothetical protein